MTERHRVPLDFDGSINGTPVVTPPEAIRARQDKRHMPGPDEPDDLEPDVIEEPAAEPAHQESVEDRAVQLLVQRLKEKGKSDRFIQEHMDEIRDAARRELSQD